jgi:hypothetical protein
LVLLSLLVAGSHASAEDAKGWDRTVRTAHYLEPTIPHPEQEKAALDKLRELEKKSPSKLNINAAFR